MAKIQLLNAAQLRQLVTLDQEALAAVARGFSFAAEGLAQLPPAMNFLVTEFGGEVDVKGAYLRGETSFAVKIASGFPANRRLGLPTGSGLMVVLSAKTGMCEAVLLDEGYLTDVRTALAGALAAKYLAPAEVGIAGVIGCGIQARYQLQALALVRDFQRVLVFGRNCQRVAAFCEEMSGVLNKPVEAAATAETVVRSSEVVVTTTPAREPLIESGWLRAGQHITAMGSDHGGKRELADGALMRADLLVCDWRQQAAQIGELQYLPKPQLNRVVELGDICCGRKPGRTRNAQLTICDLTGIGVQDTAIALFALKKAQEMAAYC